jgi:membrane protease YdiL (CAAX protease family)
MPVRRSVVIRLVVAAAVAAVLLVVVAPEQPAQRLGFLGAACAGVAGGLLLYVAVARRRPYVPPLVPPAVVACCILVVAAASEEVVWRRVVLGELLRVGPLAAVAGSTLGFALVHKTRQTLHLGTGATFAGLYLATGALAASIAAHWVYNVLLLTLAERNTRTGTPP